MNFTEDLRTPLHQKTPTSASRDSSGERSKRASKRRIKTEDHEGYGAPTCTENSSRVTRQKQIKSEQVEHDASAASASKYPQTRDFSLLPMGSCQEEANGNPSSVSENLERTDPLATLLGPPEAPEVSGVASEKHQVYTTVIIEFKKALISFLTESKIEAVADMIEQANYIFLALKGLDADYRSFYTSVRSYIEACTEQAEIQKELDNNMHAVNLLSLHEKLSGQLNEAAKAVSLLEADYQKTMADLSPLEKAVQDMKEVIRKFEMELHERKKDAEKLETDLAEKLRAKAEIDAKLRDIGLQIEETESTLRDVLARREATHVVVEEKRAQLSIN